MTRHREHQLAAAAWAHAEVEQLLRAQLAHRLMGSGGLPQEWSLTAPNGIVLYLEAHLVETSSAQAKVRVSASSSGLLRRVQLDRMLTLTLTGDAARVPDPLYLVFETGGYAVAFETLEGAGDSLESLDLEHYIGAYSDQGEVITMTPGDLYITFRGSGTYDHEGLNSMIRGSRRHSDLSDDPHLFALTVWLTAP